MELITHNISTRRINCHSDIQITLENDMNVPDTKPDVEFLVKTTGNVQMHNITPATDKVIAKGTLNFTLLYISGDDIRPIHNIEGEIPFEETINMDGLKDGDTVNCHFDLEDCQASLINSRKISIRAIVGIHCCQTDDAVVSIGTDIEGDEPFYQKTKNLAYTSLAIDRNDIFRFNDEINLPKGKPSIDKILYYDISLINSQTRIIENGLRLTGDVNVFFLYTSDEEERRVEYMETELPFDGIVNCDGCDENMIPDIQVDINTRDLSEKPDEDGENRILQLELTLKLHMKFYEDNEIDILADTYSTAFDVNIDYEDVVLDKLLMKNQSTLRIADHINISENNEILQVCNASGKIQIDEQEITDDGIQIDGALELEILYISDNDQRPLILSRGTIPFSHLIEINGITKDASYELSPEINQINILMLDNTEVEAKATISLCAIVFIHNSEKIITSISKSDFDLDKLQNKPGLVGYISENDTELWDIAKEYCTTVDSIMELNNLSDTKIHRGDKLLLLKTVV